MHTFRFTADVTNFLSRPLRTFLFVVLTLAASAHAQEMRRTEPRPTTPQTTAPSAPGTSAEWEQGAHRQFDDRVRQCTDVQLVSDALQIAAAALDRQFREGAELTDAESEVIGDSIFQTLATSPDSPMFRQVDLPQYERERQYIEAVGRSLLTNLARPGIQYDFHIVAMDVPNAFAIPGGHIFVTTGLFRDRRLIANEAQLAAILAHEIGHVDLRHTSAVFETIRAAGFDPNDPSALQASQLFAQIVRALYQSEFEDESDEYAARRMFEVGYSPFQFVDLWVAWAQVDGVSSTHGPMAEDNAGGLEAEIRNVLQSHNPAIVRACNTATHIQDIRDGFTRQNFYVGYLNLRTLVPASQRAY